ncbi:MAG: S-adenosylmethionine synthetase [Candidatus Methanomethylophilaceae archaeon]|nr:S-adenosylmethionine synthetase [Candidatus Methanomethylophilaceae archaeon]
MTAHYLISSESVTEGHPDKVCDQISDAILDAHLSQDRFARVACETVVTTDRVIVLGEISSNAEVDVEAIVREIVEEIGYNDPSVGFSNGSCEVQILLKEQSPDIAMGVGASEEERASPGKCKENIMGAGDQGMMYGFACDETRELMPMPIMLAHKLTRRLSEARKKDIISYLRPDGKAQVTIRYKDGVPVGVETVVVSAQHDPDVEQSQIKKDILNEVIFPVIPSELINERTRYLINPTGRFVVGGPQSDVGLTGRKIIVDTYGGVGRVGGGCFSGKDPSKVDRSGAYAARYVAKNIVAAGLAKKCEVAVAYAIGVANPVSVWVDCFGTAVFDEERINEMIADIFDWRPLAIIEKLCLQAPIYRQTASYGHFGRDDLDLPWEKTNLADMMRTWLD